MKLKFNKYSWFCLAAFLASSLLAAGASPREDVLAAAAALGSQTNYSWKTTVEFGLLHSSTTRHGSTVKDGYTLLATNLINDQVASNSPVTLIRGTNAAVKTQTFGWRSATAILSDQGNRGTPAWALARTAQNFQTPAVLAASFAAHAVDLQAGPNGITGTLNEESVTALLGASLPPSTNRQLTVSFWITDGRLAKYQWRATGTVTFNGSSRVMDRTFTTEISDVNTTKFEVPEEVRKMLE